MADPIDDLERALASSVNPEILPTLFNAIDRWREHHGGCRAYIARHSIDRRHKTIIKLTQDGLKPEDVAELVGVCPLTVRRVARASSYVS
jgi:hypothetical protein